MDIIGTIYTPAVLDAEGNVTTEPQALPGWPSPPRPPSEALM